MWNGASRSENHNARNVYWQYFNLIEFYVCFYKCSKSEAILWNEVSDFSLDTQSKLDSDFFNRIIISVPSMQVHGITICCILQHWVLWFQQTGESPSKHPLLQVGILLPMESEFFEYYSIGFKEFWSLTGFCLFFSDFDGLKNLTQKMYVNLLMFRFYLQFKQQQSWNYGLPSVQWNEYFPFVWIQNCIRLISWWV